MLKENLITLLKCALDLSHEALGFIIFSIDAPLKTVRVHKNQYHI